MSKITYFLIIYFVLILAVACKASIPLPTPEAVSPARSATSIPVVASTPTPLPIESPTHVPTETSFPTETPLPTATSTPFLPTGLTLIEPENIASLQRIAEIPVKEIYDLAISSSGNYVATLSEHWEDRSRYMQVWNLTTGLQVYQQEKMDIPGGLFFLPDENMLMVLFHRDDPPVRIFDLTRGEITRSLEIPFDKAALSPDGELFAASSITKDGESSVITLYDFATGEEKSALESVGQIMVLYFSPDGKHLVAGFQTNNNFRLKVWEVASLELVAEMVDYSSPVFTLDGDLAASQREAKIYLFDPKGWVLRGSFDNMDAYGNGRPRSFSKDGHILIGSDTYRTVFWEVATGKEIFNLSDYGYGIFSPAGNIVLTWCYQCNLAIWGVNP